MVKYVKYQQSDTACTYLDIWSVGRKEEQSRDDRDIYWARRIARRSYRVSHTPLHVNTHDTFLIEIFASNKHNHDMSREYTCLLPQIHHI